MIISQKKTIYPYLMLILFEKPSMNVILGRTIDFWNYRYFEWTLFWNRLYHYFKMEKKTIWRKNYNLATLQKI